MAAAFVLNPAIHTVASVPRFVAHQPKTYKDRSFKGSDEERKEILSKSTTVYVGNLSFYTNEFQLHEIFGRCGTIKRIIMGLDRFKKTPCGFCFVEFDERESAVKSTRLLNHAKLDGRYIKVDIDTGFTEGRQFGRGAGGGQISDERRREREVEGPTMRPGQPGAALFTRSITIVSCLAMLVAIACLHMEQVNCDTTIVLRPFAAPLVQTSNMAAIRRAQIGQGREQFEKAFAHYLVNVLKVAKPSLLKAFMRATLADKQLKELAISMFFNNTSTESD